MGSARGVSAEFSATMANVTLSVGDVAEHYGMLFYVISPSKTSFPTMKDCPDYLQKAMPYMVTLIVLEAIINWWMGKKHNVADSVTSISSGLVMTMVGMLTKGMMLSTYTYVHEHYRIMVLPGSTVRAMRLDYCGLFIRFTTAARSSI